MILSLEKENISVEFWEIEPEMNEDASDLARIALLDASSELMWQFSHLARVYNLKRRREKQKKQDECHVKGAY